MKGMSMPEWSDIIPSNYPRNALCQMLSLRNPARTFVSMRIIPSTGYPGQLMRWKKRAQRINPILLSIGYSACHWCHVMAHESFENEQSAAIMNANFINIKVDREERPDIDRIYQTAHQLMPKVYFQLSQTKPALAMLALGSVKGSAADYR